MPALKLLERIVSTVSWSGDPNYGGYERSNRFVLLAVRDAGEAADAVNRGWEPPLALLGGDARGVENLRNVGVGLALAGTLEDLGKHVLLLPIRHEVEGGVVANFEILAGSEGASLAGGAGNLVPAVGDVAARLVSALPHDGDGFKLALEAQIGFQFGKEGDDGEHRAAHGRGEIEVLLAKVNLHPMLGAFGDGEKRVGGGTESAIEAGVNDVLDGVVGHEANHFPHVVALKPGGFAASAGVDEVGNVLEAAQLREAGDGGSLCRDREALLFGGTPDGSHAFERDGIESGLCRLAAGPLVNALAALVCVSHMRSTFLRLGADGSSIGSTAKKLMASIRVRGR